MFYAEQSENFCGFSKRTAVRVEPDGERPDGRRRAFSHPKFKIHCIQRLSEQFLGEHRHQNQRTAHFSEWLNLTVPEDGDVNLENEAFEFQVPIPEIERVGGRIDWIDLGFIERERTPHEIIQTGIQLHLAGLSLSNTKQYIEGLGVQRRRTAIHNWIHKVDLQPAKV